jgi:hypothetical protein
MILEGQITAVEEEIAGTELAVAAVATDTSIEVVDPDELDLEGGTLLIGDETLAYEVEEGSEGEVLTDALAGSYEAGERVTQYPEEIERVAYVLGVEQEEEIEARVPHTLYDRLPVGIREDGGETVVITLDDDEWVVTDVLGKTPEADASYLNSRQDEVPIVLDTTVNSLSYIETDAEIVVTPEADGKLLVFWGADVHFEHAGVGNVQIDKAVVVSLLVDGVQVGQERTAEVDVTFAVAGPEMVIPVSGATMVEVVGGVEVRLTIGVKHLAAGVGTATVRGSKTGGLSYVAFGG